MKKLKLTIEELEDIKEKEREEQRYLWFSKLSVGLSENFKEGMVLMDYGCGCAGYVNYLKDKVKNFSYYGLEKAGSTERWGERNIDIATKSFKSDPRVSLGFIDDDVYKEALEKVDSVILGSIFTHTDFPETGRILDKLKPIVDRGGIISCSIFFKDRDSFNGSSNRYGFANCYSSTFFKKSSFKSILDDRNLQFEIMDKYSTHYICCVKSKDV